MVRCKFNGGTIKDITKTTLNPTASAEDSSEEIKRLRAEILEMRKEMQATTSDEGPKWFRKWREEVPSGSESGRKSKRQKEKKILQKPFQSKLPFQNLLRMFLVRSVQVWNCTKFLIVMTDD